jgi:hypothetical protein
MWAAQPTRAETSECDSVMLAEGNDAKVNIITQFTTKGRVVFMWSKVLQHCYITHWNKNACQLCAQGGVPGPACACWEGRRSNT